MSAGFNIETYQIGKQDGIKSGTSQVSQEILDRIQKLENSQMNIANEYYCDFSKAEYIDSYKSSVANTGSGIIPYQYTAHWFDGFDNDDNIDYDKSKDIKFVSIKSDNSLSYTSMVKLSTETTQYGEFFTKFIDLKPFIGFKFNANVKIPRTENLEGQNNLLSGNLWFAHGTDNYGRIWVFRADTYKFENSPVNLTIYNDDMTTYKELKIAGTDFFGPVQAAGAYNFSVAHNSATIIFSEENLCIIGFMMIFAEKNGYDSENAADGNCKSYIKDVVTFVNEDGAASPKLLARNRDTDQYNHPSWVEGSEVQHIRYQAFNPCILSIQKNRVFVISAMEARLFQNNGYTTNRCLRAIITPSTGLLDDVSVKVTNTISCGDYYHDNWYHHTYSTRAASKAFKRDGISYAFISGYIPAKTTTWCSVPYVTINQVFLSEVQINNDLPSYDTDNKLRLSAANQATTYIYGHGGANGLYYNEEYNYLYVFSNYTDPILKVTRYEVDWKSKTKDTIPLINPMVKEIQISASTYYPDDYTSHYSEHLKVFDDGNKLSLMYGSKNPQSGYQQINYLSIGYDMEIINPESQIHVSSGDPKDRVCDFSIINLKNRDLIVYSIGDINDYTNTAPNNSTIYSAASSIIYSTINFYYATDTDLTWKAVNPGEEKTLNVLANKISIKAVLESNKRYDTSPEIKGLYIESWDNDKQESRQSEYYSNQISMMQNEGKAVLTADYDLNNGTIDWYVSYDGGQNFSKVTLEKEFVYTHIEAPDFRIKAVLSVTDNAKKLPIIRSYTLKSNHVVLHSDLEEIQINLMKTNFKIDTLSKASRNGLFKMFIDVFSDEAGVDKSNSDYIFYPLDGAIGGNFIVTTPQIIDSNTVTILLTTSEILDDSEKNSHINYFASLDKGVTYIEIHPNIKAQLSNTNATSNNLIIKAVFYDNAKLSALGIAWD